MASPLCHVTKRYNASIMEWCKQPLWGWKLFYCRCLWWFITLCIDIWFNKYENIGAINHLVFFLLSIQYNSVSPIGEWKKIAQNWLCNTLSNKVKHINNGLYIYIYSFCCDFVHAIFLMISWCTSSVTLRLYIFYFCILLLIQWCNRGYKQ